MGILLGLVAALLYGGSDFAGGLASRRLGPVRIAVAGSAVATAAGLGGARHGRRPRAERAGHRAGGWPAAWPAGPAPSCCTAGWPAGR